MQIVIKISENAYDYIRDCDSENYIVTTELYNAVYNGVPLPENHGRLIDADELEWMVPNIEDEYEHCHRIIRDAPTIIEAE